MRGFLLSQVFYKRFFLFLYCARKTAINEEDNLCTSICKWEWNCAILVSTFIKLASDQVEKKSEPALIVLTTHIRLRGYVSSTSETWGHEWEAYLSLTSHVYPRRMSPFSWKWFAVWGHLRSFGFCWIWLPFRVVWPCGRDGLWSSSKKGIREAIWEEEGMLKRSRPRMPRLWVKLFKIGKGGVG